MTSSHQASVAGGLNKQHRSNLQKAIDDLWLGGADWRLWTHIAWLDARRRYSRSVLGPFWITISLAAQVTVFGFVFGTLLKAPRADYIPFIALGLIFWRFIAQMLQSGAQVFIDQGELIKHLPGPVTRHVYCLMTKNLIVLAHTIFVFVGVALFYGTDPGLAGFLVVPGLVLLVLNLFWVALLLGLLSARFRDIPPVVDSVMMMFFYLTPIFWSPDMLGDKAVYLVFNPFYQLLEMVRAPLLGIVPSLTSYAIVIGGVFVGWTVTLVFFARYRWRIAYWV